jgi:hypothetical protein
VLPEEVLQPVVQVSGAYGCWPERFWEVVLQLCLASHQVWDSSRH